MASRVKATLGTLALLLASTVLAMLLAELGLRLAVNEADFLHATLVEDPALGQRIKPLTTGHDALGFRNREVPIQAGVVAIGDSNTYGVSAPRDGSWPSQLSGLLGETVYNMGLGGFGPLQYLHLAQTTAKSLKPRVWVVGFYFGNDLMDAYYLAHGRPLWKDWRMSSGSEVATAEPVGHAVPKKRFESLRNWLSRHSLLYSVLRATVLQQLASQERAELVRQSAPDVQWAWSDPTGESVRTVFTPQGRLAALDLDNASVREGMQISQRALLAMQSEARSQGVKLLVVLIPTKERAYCAYLRRHGTQLPASHSRLCEAESRAKAELVGTLKSHDMHYVDVSAALEAGIDEHLQLYPADSDGHLQSRGYGIVAQVVADALRLYAPRP